MCLSFFPTSFTRLGRDFGKIEDAKETLQTLKRVQPDISIQWINGTLPFASPETLANVWSATNDQDKVLVELNQEGVNSISYAPGPYSQRAEQGVIRFVDGAIIALDPRKTNSRHFEMNALIDKVVAQWEPYVDPGIVRKVRGR